MSKTQNAPDHKACENANDKTFSDIKTILNNITEYYISKKKSLDDNYHSYKINTINIHYNIIHINNIYENTIVDVGDTTSEVSTVVDGTGNIQNIGDHDYDDAFSEISDISSEF